MKNEILKVSPSSVAQALATDYFCIYYVNSDNNKFIEYSASPEYKQLGLPSIGDDFITFSHTDFNRFLHPEDREMFLNTFTKEQVVTALNEHSTFTMTFRLMLENAPTYVHLKATRMKKRGQHHLVIGISSIDEQMKTKEAFEKAHSASVTYSRIVQALAEDYFCIYYVDMKTNQFIEYSSDQTYRALGIEKSGGNFFPLIRQTLVRHMYDEDQGAFLAAFTKENILSVLNSHKTFTLSYRLLLGGIPTYVSMKATRMKDEDGSHVIIGINNIDAQMRQQAKYEQVAEERLTYSRVAQALAMDYFSIYVVNLETKHFFEYVATQDYDQLQIEKMGEDFFNLSRRNSARVIYPEDKGRFLDHFTEENILTQLKENGSFTLKYRLMFGQVPTYVSMKATLLEDKEGAHLIIGVNNIDYQMKQEQEYQVRMTEAWNKAKNDFLTNMSHDIRTPMNAIVGYTNIARQHMDDPVAIKDSLEKIGSSSHLLLSMINDVLDMAKIENGKMQLNEGACNLSKIFTRIADITSLQAQSKSLKVSYDTTKIQHWLIRGDELRIEQILINILSNAIKYTPAGGQVYFTALEERSPQKSKNHYRFICLDTGVGISEEFLPHIFESFSRGLSTTINKVQGSGLGLSITSRIVSLMGGSISVQSKLGEGSKFTVELDLQSMEDVTLSSKDISENNVALLSGKRILLVEDNDINAEIAELTLSQYDLLVDRVENGQVSIDRLREKGFAYYDAVLMDIQMPILGGIDATKAIRALGDEFAALPIIAMSANAYPEDVRACLEAGMNAHIAKPFQPETLLGMLFHYLCIALPAPQEE